MVQTYAKKKKISEADAKAIIEASEAFSQYANVSSSIDDKAEALFTA